MHFSFIYERIKGEWNKPLLHSTKEQQDGNLAKKALKGRTKTLINMAVKISVVAFMCMVFTVYARNTLFDMIETNVKREPKVWNKSSCSRPEDGICVRRTQSWCRHAVVRDQCPRLCGECAPFTGVCPSNYKFGCCWDGTEALRFDKFNCPVCRDLSKICQNPAVKEDCDLKANSPETRKICPVTCGACHDYGN